MSSVALGLGMRPIDVAWNLLKALPEQVISSRGGAPTNPARVGYQSMHPGIQSLLGRLQNEPPTDDLGFSEPAPQVELMGGSPRVSEDGQGQIGGWSPYRNLASVSALPQYSDNGQSVLHTGPPRNYHEMSHTEEPSYDYYNKPSQYRNSHNNQAMSLPPYNYYDEAPYDPGSPHGILQQGLENPNNEVEALSQDGRSPTPEEFTTGAFEADVPVSQRRPMEGAATFRDALTDSRRA